MVPREQGRGPARGRPQGIAPISANLRRFGKEGVDSDVIGTQACHLVSHKSIDSAPLPLTTMTRRSDRSNTKYSIPSPFFDPNQFRVHPSGKWTMSAPVKMMNRPPATILPKKPEISPRLPNDCPMIMSQAINLGMFLAVSCSREPLIPGVPNPGAPDHPKSFCMP